MLGSFNIKELAYVVRTSNLARVCERESLFIVYSRIKPNSSSTRVNTIFGSYIPSLGSLYIRDLAYKVKNLNIAWVREREHSFTTTVRFQLLPLLVHSRSKSTKYRLLAEF